MTTHEITNRAAINSYIAVGIALKNLEVVLHEVAVSKIMNPGNPSVDQRAAKLQFMFEQMQTASRICFSDFETHLKDNKKAKEMKAKLEKIFEEIWQD